MVTLKQTTSTLLLLLITLGPVSPLLAQTNQQQPTNQQNGTWVTGPNGQTTFQQGQTLPGSTSGPTYTTNQNTQGSQYITGNNTSGSQANQQYQAIVSQYGECAISQIVARGISNVLTEAVSEVVDVVESVVAVPISSNKIESETEKTRKETNLLRNKEVAQGPTILGVPILPSWDAIGYCIVNTIIEYISESTIRWINSGFQGNPVFVDNFGQFFKDLADVETATFLNELSAPGFLCDPYRVTIQTGLLAAHADPYYQPQYRGRLGTGRVTGYGQCTFDQAQVSLQAYVAGNPQAIQQGGWNSWYQLTQRPANNIYGSYEQARIQQAQRVTNRQQVAGKELQINEGFLSFKDDKNRITTPGKIIQSQIENRLNIPENRLVLAREFDEVVNALVDRLVKIALNEVLTSINGD